MMMQGSGPACNGQPLSRGVSEAEMATILEVHNRYRAKIARGEERRGSPGPQPPAANMKIMVSCPSSKGYQGGPCSQMIAVSLSPSDRPLPHET